MSLSTYVSVATSFTSTNLGAGLDLWAKLGRIVRVSTRSGMMAPPFSNSSGFFVDSAKVQGYYLGAEILLGLLILALLFTIITGLSELCCVCCCMKSIRRKRIKKSTRFQRGCSVIWIIAIFAVYLVGAFTSFTGKRFHRSGLYSLIFTVTLAPL